MQPPKLGLPVSDSTVPERLPHEHGWVGGGTKIIFYIKNFPFKNKGIRRSKTNLCSIKRMSEAIQACSSWSWNFSNALYHSIRWSRNVSNAASYRVCWSWHASNPADYSNYWSCIVSKRQIGASAAFGWKASTAVNHSICWSWTAVNDADYSVCWSVKASNAVNYGICWSCNASTVERSKRCR